MVFARAVGEADLDERGDGARRAANDGGRRLGSGQGDGGREHQKHNCGDEGKPPHEATGSF